MKIIQLKLFLFYYKGTLHTTIILLLIFLLLESNLIAQKEGNVKLKIETGILWDWVGGRVYSSGAFVNVEPKLKISKNTIIGFRLTAAFNTQRILNSDTKQFVINNYNENGGNNHVASFVPTIDYYFNNKFSPYLGLGAGYYFLNTSKTAFVVGVSDLLDLSINNTFGVLLRGGFNLHKLKVKGYDLSRFTIGLEFNYIPKSDVEISNRQVVGTIVTSNIALSIGYIIDFRRT